MRGEVQDEGYRNLSVRSKKFSELFYQKRKFLLTEVSGNDRIEFEFIFMVLRYIVRADRDRSLLRFSTDCFLKKLDRST